MPLIGYAQATNDDNFDDAGLPLGKAWRELGFSGVDDENAYAIEVSGNLLEPAFRDGTILVVAPSASIHRGDRVVIKTKDGKLMVRELKRRTSKIIELRAIDSERAEQTCRSARCCGCSASSGRASGIGSRVIRKRSRGKPDY